MNEGNEKSKACHTEPVVIVTWYVGVGVWSRSSSPSPANSQVASREGMNAGKGERPGNESDLSYGL